VKIPKYRYSALVWSFWAAKAGQGMGGSRAMISYDEKRGIQAIGTSLPRRRPGAPDLPPASSGMGHFAEGR
jgi:hypothetical protein